MDILKSFGRAASAVVASACCLAAGCMEPQEYADLRSQREIYIQKHLPEVHLVLADLNQEIAQQDARLSDRAAKLSANGRTVEGDAAYRRWNGLRDDMTRDRDKLSRIADDVYFKFDELQLAGSEDPQEQEDLAELMDDARSTAGEIRDRLEGYRSKLSGANAEIANDEPPSGVTMLTEDRAYTFSMDEDGDVSYSVEENGVDDESYEAEEVFDDAPMQPHHEESLVAAPEDEASRSWKDASGDFRVGAVLRGVSDPHTDRTRVWLRRDDDGGTISVPYESLSRKDRLYVDRRLGL